MFGNNDKVKYDAIIDRIRNSKICMKGPIMGKGKQILVWIFMVILLPFTVYSQWILTNGSSGPLFEDIKSCDSYLFAASWSSGVYRSVDNGSNWAPTNNGLTLNTEYMFADGTTIWVSSRDQGVFRSSDYGTSWSSANNGISNMNTGYFAKIGSTIFVSSYGGGIFRSSDNGINWTQVNNGLTDLNVWAFGACETTLFVSTANEGLFRSTDNGDNWTLINSNLTCMQNINSIGTKIFLGHRWGNGVCRSDDNGNTWTQMNNGLTNGQVIQFAIYGTNLFAATLGGGVFLSTDYGENWTPVNEGLGDLSALTLHIYGTDLFVGNNGGGIWKRPLSEMVTTLTDGLVAYYPFNGNANDESGNGNNGVIYGADLTLDRFGNNANAYHFDGINDYIDCSNSSIFNISSEITLSCWVRTNDNRSGLIGRPTMISKWSYTDEGQAYWFALNEGKLGSTFNAITGEDNENWGNTKINDNQWHLVTVSADGNLIQKQIKVYIDGQLDCEYDASGTIIKTSNSNVLIGVCLLPDHGSFLGDIDDIRIYSRALSEAEIDTLYHEGGWTGNDINAGLVAYYPFNGNANDESGNVNNGVVYGAILATDRFGASNKAYYFDGVDDWIKASADPLPTADRTVSVWYKGNNNGKFVSYGGGECATTWLQGFYNGIVGEGTHCYDLHQIYCDAPIGDGWHHMVVTTDNIGSTIILDGNLVISNSDYVDNTNTVGKIMAFGVAVAHWGTEPFVDGESCVYYNGFLDDIRIYNRALNEAEIDSLYHESGWTGNDINSGLVAYYPFNGNANDESGNNNNGTVYGASLSIDRFGIANNAFYFDGVDDWIKASSDPLPSAERTISVWYKMLYDTVGTMLSYGGNGCQTTLIEGYNIYDELATWGHCWDPNFISGPAPTGSGWHNLVFLTNSYGSKMAVDGVIVSENQNYSNNIYTIDKELAIGTCVDTDGHGPFTDGVSVGCFTGYLDDIRIYDRALSETEIKDIYHEGGWMGEVPQNLSAVAGNGQVTLTWNKSDEIDFLRYRIYSGISPNPTTKIDSTIGGASDTTKIISELTNGTTYYFRVTAVDNAGRESGYSNEVSSTPINQITVSIADLRASVSGQNILLEWTAPNNATEFNVYRGTTYDFIPDLTNGTNRIGDHITDQDESTEGIQWTDTGNGADIVGDLNVNFFYQVTAFVPATQAAVKHAASSSNPKGTPHTATGQIYNSDNSVPGDADIRFSAYITSRPEEILIQTSFGCGYQNGYWGVSVGNFPTDWSAGKTLHLDVENTSNGECGSLEMVLTNNDPDIAPDLTLSNIIESDPSNTAGEFDIALTTTPTTDINEVVLIMETADTQNPITTAEELGLSIPNCSVVYYWDAAGQGTAGHPIGLPFNNFAVQTGHPYAVNVTADGIWSHAGKVEHVSFNLITTESTDINHIGLSFNQTELTTAEELGQDIIDCSTVYAWNAAGQGTIGHVVGLPFNDFSVRPGYPYYVNVTSNSTWPPEAAASNILAKSQSKSYSLSKQRPSGSGVPHLVYGEYKTIDEDHPVTLRSWVAGRENDILTETHVGAGTDEQYWWVEVSNFESAWQPGDVLHVELLLNKGEYSGTETIRLTTQGADVGEPIEIAWTPDHMLPTKYALLHNYPNPFNPETHIRYELPEQTNIKIEIYDVTGSLVRTLVNKQQPAGRYEVIWDGKNSQGNQVVSGLYFYKMITTQYTHVKKMMLVK